MARPDPIPNSAVKHRIADGSACIACARVGSRRTFQKQTKAGLPTKSGFFVGPEFSRHPPLIGCGPHNGALPDRLHWTSFHQRLHRGYPTCRAHPSKASTSTKSKTSAKLVRSARPTRPGCPRFDDAVLAGWNLRPADQALGLSKALAESVPVGFESGPTWCSVWGCSTGAPRNPPQCPQALGSPGRRWWFPAAKCESLGGCC